MNRIRLKDVVVNSGRRSGIALCISDLTVRNIFAISGAVVSVIFGIDGEVLWTNIPGLGCRLNKSAAV